MASILQLFSAFSFTIIAVGFNNADAAVPRKVLLNRGRSISHSLRSSLYSRAHMFGGSRDVVDGQTAKWAEEKQTKFNPSTTACCKQGYKAAKKGLDCSTSITIADRMYSAFLTEGVSAMEEKYHVPVHVKELSKNIETCIQQSFQANFKKCCQLKTDYKQAMQMCRRYRGPNKRMRRSCRDKVRQQYRA